MKKMVLASACILALASPAAFAQKAQPGDGASSQGNVGPGASQEPPAAPLSPASTFNGNRAGSPR